MVAGWLGLPREGTQTELEAEAEKYEEYRRQEVCESERPRADGPCWLHTEQLQLAASEVDGGCQTQPAETEGERGETPAPPPAEVVAGQAGQGLPSHQGDPLHQGTDLGVQSGPGGSHDVDHEEGHHGNTWGRSNDGANMSKL